MSNQTMASIAAFAMCLGVFVAGPVSAQTPAGPTFKDANSQHHQMLNQVMKDITQEMTAMTDQMSRGELTAGQNKQMSDRMTGRGNGLPPNAGLEASAHITR